MDNERKVVRIASSDICGTNISIILEAFKNGNIVILDNEIINPLEDRKEVFETIINYEDIINKSKKKHNWRKKNFYD